eukprot:TRINITY_DN9784_c0_g1_i8.p1 TRINITY_DN9784_c0_g1~~TRINITY_DN9784_c0_g1_i8.p1  ORF type:complete len:108 (+),score=4.95 TRINITY_DN9784_c0_g1_i8:91-414(+)
MEIYLLIQLVIVSLVYLTIARPDIAFAVHVVSQFVAQPTHIHWAAVLRILRYLQGTSNRALLLSSSQNLTLHGYFDSCWAGEVMPQDPSASNLGTLRKSTQEKRKIQ